MQVNKHSAACLYAQLMSVGPLPSSSHECDILTETAMHRSMLYQVRKHCITKVLMRLLPAATVHTSHLQETTGQQDARLTHSTSGGVRSDGFPSQPTQGIKTFTVQEMDFIMYLLQLARYAVHVHMAICAHYHYICIGQSVRFQSLLEQWYLVFCEHHKFRHLMHLGMQCIKPDSLTVRSYIKEA